jgi:hypothetical protein
MLLAMAVHACCHSAERGQHASDGSLAARDARAASDEFCLA